MSTENQNSPATPPADAKPAEAAKVEEKPRELTAKERYYRAICGVKAK